MDLIAFITEKGWLGLAFPVGGEEGMHQNFLVQIHKKRADMRSIKQKCNCCRKTAACIGDLGINCSIFCTGTRTGLLSTEL